MSERLYDVVLVPVVWQTDGEMKYMPPEQVRWAIAGRNRQKLEAVKDAVGAAVDVLVADSQDQQAIDAIVAQTRVLPPPDLCPLWQCAWCLRSVQNFMYGDISALGQNLD